MIIFDEGSTHTIKSTFIKVLIILFFVNILAYFASAESDMPPFFFNILFSLIVIIVIISGKPTLIKIEYNEEQKELILSTINYKGKTKDSIIMINDLRCKVENFVGSKGSFNTYLCFYDKEVLIDKIYVGSSKIESKYSSLIQKLDDLLIQYQEKQKNGYEPKVMITI